MYYHNNPGHQYSPSTGTAFGVADRVAAFIATHSSGCLFLGAFVWFVIMVIFKLNKC